jgi:hypothetical protein
MNRLFIIDYDELSSGERLYDGLTLDQIKVRIQSAFPGCRTVIDVFDFEARVKFQVRSPQDNERHTEPELLVRLCRSEDYLNEVLALAKEKVAAAASAEIG